MEVTILLLAASDKRLYILSAIICINFVIVIYLTLKTHFVCRKGNIHNSLGWNNIYILGTILRFKYVYGTNYVSIEVEC